MAKSKKISIARRNFLKGAAGGAAALAAGQQTVKAQQAAEPPRYAAARPAPAETDPTPNIEVLTADRPGSDFMTDIIKSLGFEFVFANPGSSFRGLQESITVYGANKSPEFITCCHEESSVAMAHGYAKIEGRPACVFAHGTVGLQHASMAIYNAYCDRVPVVIILGNLMDATSRRPGAEWNHSVQDAASMVRDYIKWDDNPASLTHFAESAVRAYKIAMTPPMLPVVLVADGDLQENAIAPDARLHIPKLVIPAPPQGDSGAVAEVATLLVAAENPVLVAGRAARTPAGMKYLVELAEVLQAPVIDQAERMNFPTRHALNHTDRSRALIANADVIVGLELTDFWGTVNSYRDQLHRTSKPITKSTAKLISITSVDLYTKSNYQDFQRFPEVDLAIAADAEATLPALTEEVKRLITADKKRGYQDRGAKLATAKQQSVERARTEATYAWDASPISTSRLSAEMWAQIKDKDWSVVSAVSSISNWPLRLWSFDKHYQYIGGAGGAGIGYGAPAATGAAIANRKHGRLTVNFQNDGDMMYGPGILWTAAHHKIPLLSVVHNNRAYHQELMHLQRMANRHQRGIDTCSTGTTLDNPNIDYAKIAQGMGVYAQGPITDPKELGPAIGRAVEVAMKGEPALIDVVTQPR